MPVTRDTDTTETGTEARASVVPAVLQAWARLFALLVVAILVSAAIMMPVTGTVLAVLGVLAVRVSAAGPAAAGRAVLRTVLTIPYALAAGVVVTLALATLAALTAAGAHIDELDACASGAGAGVAVLWAGPGIRGPRRRLERMFGRLAAEPHRFAPAGAAVGTLALLAVIGAVSLTPSFAPMYGLQTWLATTLDLFQDTLR